MLKQVFPKELTFSLTWVFLIIVGITGCNSGYLQNDAETSFNEGESKATPTENILVPNPTRSLDYFPCNNCHNELVVNAQRRELVDMHNDIIFEHDSENRWCLACHDAESRDSLRLANGRLLGFDKSYELCGQCHGPKYRDWKLGIHGKRSGEWNGQKNYFLCVHCHDPHSPRFKLLEPMPPPLKPDEIRMDSIKRYGDG